MNARDAQRYVRVAGWLILISIFAGGFGESYVPGKLLAAHDVAETAHRVAASVGLLRAGFASYLLEAMCDLSLTAIFYVLLRPVSRTLSMIALCFGVFGTATFAVGEVFYFSAALPATDAALAGALGPDARMWFPYLCLTVYEHVFGFFTAMYGIPTMIRGYLMYRSGYLPRVLGVVVVLGGAGFVAKNCAAILAPKYDSMLYVLPTFVAGVFELFWFLVKGIDTAGWDRRASATAMQAQ
jgi:Domain of unknown function (DUF4386)